MEEYLKKILAAENQANMIEDDAQKEAEQIIQSAKKKATQRLAQAEKDAEDRLAALRDEARADAEREVAELQDQHTVQVTASKERFEQVRGSLIDRICHESEIIPDLPKD
jgi:F0F1-type ATP synthase membrane subunit b/b'